MRYQLRAAHYLTDPVKNQNLGVFSDLASAEAEMPAGVKKYPVNFGAVVLIGIVEGTNYYVKEVK